MLSPTVGQQAMSPSAFISYAHEDHAFASWISIELHAIGVEAFLDKERLQAGDRLPFALEKAIAKTDVFLFVATPEGLASEWTNREFLWAMHWERRICAIYPNGVPQSPPWPGLKDLLAIDATASLGAVIDGAPKQNSPVFCRSHWDLQARFNTNCSYLVISAI
jgi:hypothetical protein